MSRGARPVASLLLACIVGQGIAVAAPDAKSGAARTQLMREMQIHKMPQLGLEIWTENEPPWETRVVTNGGQATLITESPPGYHPPTVMTYASYQKERVPENMLRVMAIGAIRRASLNFGLTEGQSRSINPAEASYGVLHGYEGVFYGKVGNQLLDVQIFVGQAANQFPVVLTIYTKKDKLQNLSEQRRRAWSKLNYLEKQR